MTTPKTWFITGASSGLGLALTRLVLAVGDRVVATSRRGVLPVQHPSLSVVRLNPADRDECRRAILKVSTTAEK